MKRQSYIFGLLTAMFLVGCGGTTTPTDGVNSTNNAEGSNSYSNDSNENDSGSSTSSSDGNSEGSESSESSEGSESSSSGSTSIHNQGKACLSCHSSGGESFASGGTVYTNSSSVANGYTIRLVKSDGSLASYLEGRGTGNSHLITFSGSTFTAKVIDPTGNIVNSSGTNTHDSSRLDCNRCHTATGTNGAPGRILSSTQSSSSPAPTPTPSTSTAVTTLSTDVMPILTSKCKGCHGSSGNFTITSSSATYTNIISNSLVNTTTPTSSKLLQKPTGNSHVGGTVISTSSTEYTTLKAWITQGAKNN